MSEVRITERGWPGHYIMGYACLFRRNTLLEYGEKKYIVSTIGSKFKNLAQPREGYEEVGHNRWFETCVFKAIEEDGYIDIDPAEELYDYEEGLFAKTIEELKEKYPTVDNKANEMHDAVVAKVADDLRSERL